MDSGRNGIHLYTVRVQQVTPVYTVGYRLLHGKHYRLWSY